jgi:hypothetical protein
MTPESKKTMLWTMGLVVGLILVAGVVLLAVGGTPA